MNRRIVAIILMIVGGAIFLGVLLFVLDRATSAESDGLGTWIFAILGVLLSAATGLKGWRDFKKKDTPASTTTITAGNDSQVATGPNSRQVQVHGGSYVERADKVVIQTEKTSLSTPHQLPQPPADFTGREELIAELIDDFHSHKGAAITGKSLHGLIGMGGVGKTALGLVVAHKLSEDYTDAQIFLDLKGTTQPLSAVDIMLHVILSFEPTVDLRALDENGLGNAYRTVLNNKKALLFLDNARSADQVTPLIPPETCAILVTSRWTFSAAGLRSHRLGVMKEEDAVTFLLELCLRIGEHATDLAKACAYLPLALRIAGSFLQVNDHWPVKEYLEQLNDQRGKLFTLEDSRSQTDLGEESLQAAFELSYQQLPADDQKRWRVLSVFPASFDWIAASAMWELEEETLKHLGYLLRYSLLDYDEASARYSLHDLLAEYARSQMKDGENYEAHLKHATHYRDVLGAANIFYSKGGENVLSGLHLFDLEWENIQAGLTWVSQDTDSKKYLEICNEYPNAGRMILSLRLHPEKYIDWLEKGLNAARKLSNRKYEGYHLGNLGSAYADLGDVNKAIEYYELALVIVREISDRGNEGQALNNLGLVYTELGDANKAIEFYEKSLAIAREIGDRRGEGNTLGNLGVVHAELGDANKAIEFYEQWLVIAREIGDRRGGANSSWNLSLIYEKQGELEKAIKAMQVCVDFEREIGHPDVEKDAAYVEELRKRLSEHDPRT